MQTAQLTLLSVQGILLIQTGNNELNIPIWLALAVLSLGQVLLIFAFPKKVEVETKTMVDRSAMLRLRLLALIPYSLIIIGLLLAN